MRSKKKSKSLFEILGIKVFEKKPIIPMSNDLEVCILELIYLAENDMRLLGLLISWGKIHCDSLIYEKLEKKYKEFEKYRGESIVYEIFLIYCFHFGQRRNKKRFSKQENIIYFPNSKATKTMIKKSGSSEVLEPFNILISDKLLRIREEDIYSKVELAKNNKQYRNRYQYGPNWRADIIYEIETGAKNPNEISKKLGCSYEPVYRVWNEYKILTS